MAKRKNKGISLVEILISLTMLSMLALPMGMFIVEYTKGSSDLGDRYQILNLVEQKMEAALALPFAKLPEKETNSVIVKNSKTSLDLRPAQVGKAAVVYHMNVTTLPAEFSAVRDAYNGQLQNARVENGLKKIEIKAIWGKNKSRMIKLIAYKANL